jgi:hypothetical protein
MDRLEEVFSETGLPSLSILGNSGLFLPLFILDSRQREFLELVARSATFRDVLEVPKELLKAFLVGKKK